MPGGGLGAEIVWRAEIVLGAAIKAKSVWGLRPHTCFSLLLRNLGPRTPPDTNLISVIIHIEHYCSDMGMDYYSDMVRHDAIRHDATENTSVA